MNFVLQPWQLLLAILAGWINRRQQEVIEYPRRRDGFRPEPNSGFGIGLARYRPASAQPVPYQERIHDQEG